ncbi:hypothetical protein L6452_36602 [Arctium lappa]|uniref:Uncharacterized protein n=1 Tax=Arctium lappa TaxID=4217 RepID=A0ACB8YA48_ARCLA|nr:hypothetical protein L6452_36602 [Arctium lappa]
MYFIQAFIISRFVLPFFRSHFHMTILSFIVLRIRDLTKSPSPKGSPSYPEAQVLVKAWPEKSWLEKPDQVHTQEARTENGLKKLGQIDRLF